MNTTTTLPSDLDVLDAARRHLSAARDELLSDTPESIHGRRSDAVAEAITEALQAIGMAKGDIDSAKRSIYRRRA